MNNKNMTAAYYITSMLSGIIELGTIFFGLKYNYSTLQILGLALSYQLGNILRFFINERVSKYKNIIWVSITFLSVALMIVKPLRLKYCVAILFFLLLSTMLQNTRSAVKGDAPKWKKRSCRVLGFISSAIVFFCAPYVYIVISAVLTIINIHLPKYSYDNWIIEMAKNHTFKNNICYPMVTHQAHYFAYNYLILIACFEYYKSPIIATLWFAGNWIPYTITEPLVKKTKMNNWMSIAIFAHLFNAVILSSMSIFVNKNLIIVLLLWILTGFGGGNVFCVKKALEPYAEYSKKNWSLSEQIGHVLGVVFSIIMYSIFKNIQSSLFGAAGFAILTIPTIILTYNYYKKEKKQNIV